MSEGSSRTVLSASARLLEREQRIAALEAGDDLLLEGATPGECLACLHGPLLGDSVRVGLVVVPDLGHVLCRAARATGLPIRVILVTPDMSESERRDLGIALQNHTVQLVFVTPERLGQPRFVQFIRGLKLAYVAVASIERLLPEGDHYFPPYESCRALRGLFPRVPLAGMSDVTLAVSQRAFIAVAFGIAETRPAVTSESAKAVETDPSPSVQEARVAEVSTPTAVPASPAPEPPLPRKPVEKPPVPERRTRVHELFEQELSVLEVMKALDRDEAWVYEALRAYIQQSGRTHPFPWVSKPVYLAVSLAAGQAETTNPRIVGSILGASLPLHEIVLVLTALDNRNRSH